MSDREEQLAAKLEVFMDLCADQHRTVLNLRDQIKALEGELDHLYKDRSQEPCDKQHGERSEINFLREENEKLSYHAEDLMARIVSVENSLETSLVKNKFYKLFASSIHNALGDLEDDMEKAS